MKKTILTLLTVAFSFAIVKHVNAQVAFAYEESVDGDLPNTNPVPILPFEIGTNTVTGTISLGTSATDPISDFDYFGFEVPANAQITSACITQTDPLGSFNRAFWILRAGIIPSGPEFIQRFEVFSPDTVLLKQPLDSGIYNIVSSGIALPFNSSTSYRFSFEMEEILLLGDINQDGLINLLDVAPFIELLTNSKFQAAADINQDGIVNLLDVGPFVELLAG